MGPANDMSTAAAVFGGVLTRSDPAMRHPSSDPGQLKGIQSGGSRLNLGHTVVQAHGGGPFPTEFRCLGRTFFVPTQAQWEVSPKVSSANPLSATRMNQKKMTSLFDRFLITVSSQLRPSDRSKSSFFLRKNDVFSINLRGL